MSQTNWNDFTPVDDGAPAPQASANAATNWDDFTPAPETPARGFKGWARDVAGTAINSAIGVPEAVVGLADIPTGGAVGKFLENEGGSVGFRPKQAKEFVNETIKSDASREARRRFAEADGIVDKTVAAVQNPSLIFEGVGESLGAMGAGGVAARGLMAATRLGQMGAKGAAIAGAGGEGLAMAGSAAEQIRQETDDGLLTPAQSGIAAATGLAGAALGVGGAKLAQRLGVGDADTMLAQGMKGINRQNADEAAAAAANPLVQQQAAKSIPRSVIEGAISEGLFEELPQSVTEQVLQNIALGKDWHQDVDAAVVMGALSGGAMGGAAAGYRSATRPGETEARAPAPPAVPPAPGQPPQTGPVLGLPAPDRGVIQVAGDGTARTPAYQTPGYVGDVTDVEPKVIDPVRDQVAAAAEQGGALSPAALTAIDTGAAAAVQPPEAALDPAAPISLEEADARDQAAYEQFFASADAEPVVARYFENDDDIPDFDAASNVSDEDFLRALGATDEDIQDAIATTRQPASPQGSAAVDAGAQTNEPAGTGQGAGADQAAQGQVAAAPAPGVPTSLREGLVQTRTQKQQEAANAQAATPEATPTTQPVPAAGTGAVEAARPASIPATTGATSEPQADQTVEASPQPPQAGAAPAASAAPGQAGTAAPAGTSTVRALNDGSPAQNAGAQAAPAAGAQGEAQGGAVEALRQQLRDVEARIVQAAPAALGQGGGDIEAAMKSRKVPVTLKAQRKKLVEQVRAAQATEVRAFAPETGTLGIPRADMPQVPAQSHGGLVKHLNAQGIKHETTMMDTADLKPTQAEYSPAKVKAAKEATGDRAVIVSSDGHIIDGHHQAMAAAEEGKPVKAIVLDAPVEQALKAVKNSPSAQQPSMAPETGQAATAPTQIRMKDADRINPAIAAVREHVAGEIDKAALVERLRPLGLTEAQVGSVTMRLGEDFTAADIRAVLSAPPTATAPTANKRVQRGILAKKTEAEEKARADYFTPGNVIKSYGGHDRVVSYQPTGEDGRWGVTVRAVEKQGEAWVDAPGERERTHATPPDARELKTGPVARAAQEEAPAPEPAATEPSAAPVPATATPAQAAADAPAPADRITDFGEKIGGARKDQSTNKGAKAARPRSADERPAWARRFEISQIAKSSRVGEQGRWVVRDTRRLDAFNQPRQMGRETYATREEAEQAVPLLAVSQKHRVVPARGDGAGYEIWRDVSDRKRVKVVDQVFPTREAALEYMAGNAQAIIETNTTFGEADLPRPPSDQRLGAERRTSDARDSDFMEVFGFRGVEFGNWNNQQERQELLNDAYDGLLDLAEVMDISPRAISLNGELALAFGARGHGLSGARAHYELDKVVINLTKMNGAGSLAHEWFHALDHYFGRQDGKAPAEWVVAKDGTRSLRVHDAPEDDMASGGTRGERSGMRPELREAFADVMRTIARKAEAYVEDAARADKFVATARQEVKQRLDGIRAELARDLDARYYKRHNKAATADQLAEFDSVAEKIVAGELLELRVESKGSGRSITSGIRWTNDALNRLSVVMKAVRGRQGFSADQDGPLDRLRGLMQNYSARLKMLADAQASTEKSRAVPTEFVMNAKELDQGRGQDYWTRPHELAARAFQGYVEDKIAQRGGRSPFLNYGPENAVIPTPWGFKRPFPAGAERAAINQSLDKLVEVIQTREGDDGGVVLFSRSPDTQAAYEARIDALFSGESAARVGARVLDRSDVLGLLEIAEKPLVLQESKVVAGQDNHPHMTAAVWKKVPAWLDNPSAVFNSDTESGRLVFVAPEMVNGGPVVMIVEPNPAAGGKAMSVSLLVNAYDKSGGSPFGRWIADGFLKYADTKTFPAVFAQSVGRQLPDTALKNKPGTGRILTEKQLAGYRRANSPSFDREVQAGMSPEQAVAALYAERQGSTADLRDAQRRQSDERLVATQTLVDGLAKNWTRAPEIIVARNMQDPQIPQRVRDYDAKLKSQGSDGEARGFIYGGKVYLLSDELKGPQQIAEVLFHEVLGHYGLRGAFGEGLTPILQQIGAMRRAEVVAKAREYGMVKKGLSDADTWAAMSSNDRLSAAEEVLAEMAQTQPTIGFVQRAIAAIRTWLRANVPGFREMALTDAEIVRSYILPARGYVTRSQETGAQSLERAMAAFSRAPVGDQTDPDIRFSRAKLNDLKASAIDQLHQTLSHPGKVSLWDKTVGTMRNLAERNLAFKPVFEAAQRFIDDVAMLANDAAEFAPRLLPRVETWRDLRKNPISAQDNKAIARPIFDGTLLWGRDVDGKPVLVRDLESKYANLSADDKAQMMLKAGRIDPGVLSMWRGLPLDQYETAINTRFTNTLLKAGVAWTDQELKDLFQATPEQASLYREARKAIDRSIDMTSRADMLRLLGEPHAPMRDAVLEAPTLTDAMTLLVESLEQDARENPDDRERLAGLMHGLRQRQEKASELMAQGYAPLSRFGRYTVDVVDAAGERQYFGMFETAREANQMALRMRSTFQDAKVTQGTMSQEAYKLFAGITPESLEMFGNMLGLDSEGSDAQDKAFQEYLRLTKNNHSALKRLIHRQGIAGYSEDVGRVLASFVYSNARQAAGALNAGTMERSIGNIPKEQGELKDVALGLQSYIRDPQEEGQAIRGMLFAQYLGGSVASAVVNMTQPFQITLPWLSQYGGMKSAGAQLARAVKDMARRGHKYEADLAQALKHAEDDGVVSPQEIHQLMAQARGSGSLRAGDGTRVGDLRAKAVNQWEKTKVLWGQPFALAEQFNRRSTFIAAYRLAKEQGKANPAEFARRAVLETQFLYSKANKPRWARGAIGGTVFTFKTYSVSYLELMHRMWTQGGPEGKRAVGWAVAMLLLMGGAGGLPFMEDAEDLIDGAGQLMGHNVSTKQWRMALLRDVLGKELASFVEQGVSGLPGAPVDVSGRLGMGNLIPGTGLFLDKPNRTRDMTELVGPAGDLISRGFTGARKALTGDLAGAALEVSPVAVRNVAKGADMATSGIYKDAKGYKVIDTTLDEALAKAIGFQPKPVAQVQEAAGFMQRSRSFYVKTSSEIKAQWAQALFNKDEAALEDVRERLAAWNRNNPEQPIVVKMPDVWKRVREMGKGRNQRIAETAPKALREQMRNMARENG